MVQFRAILAAAAFAGVFSTSAAAAPLSLFPFGQPEAPQATSYAPVEVEQEATAELPSKFKRQVVSYPTHETPGTVVIDTPNTFLYLVLGNGRALRERQPYLPRFMAGGPGNPLGARAMYLSGSVYRIHGTNAPDTIGKRVSSGCIRLTNEDVSDLYERVTVGAKVIVLPMAPTHVSVRTGFSTN
jgi:lipoprotein-anchoring transpeptidase ErfK/SrfK